MLFGVGYGSEPAQQAFLPSVGLLEWPVTDILIRNVDRILTASTPQNNMLSYKEHGLLLCEVHVLRQRAAKVLPGKINNEFLEEVHDLVDLRTGVERQLRVVERIRWAYAKYLH